MDFLEPVFIHQTTLTSRQTTAKQLNHIIDFRIGAVDQAYFPLKKWRQISNAVLKEANSYTDGTALSIQQRWRLIQWVHQERGYLIEDNYDGEYRYGQKMLPALASLDTSRIVYLGTFSKAFLPAIRLAYMVLPESLLTSYHAPFRHFEHHASLLHQLAMTEFMRLGESENHIKRMRKVYKGKMHFLVNQINSIFTY